MDNSHDGEVHEDLGTVSWRTEACQTSVWACFEGAPNDREPLFEPGATAEARDEVAEAPNELKADRHGETDEALRDHD